MRPEVWCVAEMPPASSEQPYPSYTPTLVWMKSAGCICVLPCALRTAEKVDWYVCQAASCDTASIRLVIAPDAEPDVFTATGGVSMPGDVATNDNAPAVSVFSALTTPTRGTLVFNADGSFTYTPRAGAVGADAFDYSVCLPAPDNAVCDVGTVTINVSAAPIDAVDDGVGESLAGTENGYGAHSAPRSSTESARSSSRIVSVLSASRDIGCESVAVGGGTGGVPSATDAR